MLYLMGFWELWRGQWIGRVDEYLRVSVCLNGVCNGFWKLIILVFIIYRV